MCRSGLAKAASTGRAQGVPLAARISVQGIPHDITAGATFGDFYRPVAPGDWLVTASLAGYGNASVPVSVPKDGSGVVLDFQLGALDKNGRPVSGLQVRFKKARNLRSAYTSCCQQACRRVLGFRRVLPTCAELRSMGTMHGAASTPSDLCFLAGHLILLNLYIRSFQIREAVEIRIHLSR